MITIARNATTAKRYSRAVWAAPQSRENIAFCIRLARFSIFFFFFLIVRLQGPARRKDDNGQEKTDYNKD
jgi:hypothetical protein